MKTPTHDEERERAEKERAEQERADKDKGRAGQASYGGTAATRSGAAAREAPDPYKTYTLADFANEFLANLPAGAAGGTYVATEGDMWSDPAAHPWSIDSGNHDSHGWRFTFRDGRFVEARRFVDDAGTAPAAASSRR